MIEKDWKKIVIQLVDSQSKLQTRFSEIEDEALTLRKQDDDRIGRIKEHDQKIEEQKRELLKQADDLKEQKDNQIQYFGLFVAIFTAISIDIQLLKFAQNAWTVAGLMLMVNTAPLLFFWLIRSFDKKYTIKENLLFALAFLTLLITGSILIHFGTKNGQPDTIIERVEKYQTEKTKEEINTKENSKQNIIKKEFETK